jgi:hypothetical protein
VSLNSGFNGLTRPGKRKDIANTMRSYPAHLGLLPILMAALVTMSLPAAAQVITPIELSDPTAQHLQQRHLHTLMMIGSEVEEHKFPYPFYFSRTLDVDLDKIAQTDQRSIRFDSYKNQTVLEITGNYYASYSAEKMDAYMRLKATFDTVVMPLLAAAAPHFPDDSEFSAFAIEVSHHVRRKLMNVASEGAENVAVIIPVSAAQKLVEAKTDDQRQAAILDAQVFLNGEPFAIWLLQGAPTEEWKERNVAPVAANQKPVMAANANTVLASPSVAANLIKPAASPMRLLTPDLLATLQHDNQDLLDAMTKSMDGEAHFFPYAPPTFIGFRQGAYLQLSFSTTLEAPADASRYKLAALAFDEHVSHLIRPLLGYFPKAEGFDGVDFSSTVHLATTQKVQAVEFFFPFNAMRCFANFDCTGQQLIDSGTVVINGERSALDLQVAEGKN